MLRRPTIWLLSMALIALVAACAGGPPISIADPPAEPVVDESDESGEATVDAEADDLLNALIEDGGETQGEVVPPPPLAQDAPMPFADLSDAEIHRMVKADPASLGPMSIGFTNSGALMNGVPMPAGDRWDIVNPRETWGTPETIQFLTTAIDIVNELHPNTPPIYLGDISDSDGGRLNRHISHQAGRDADIGFYYKEGKGTWYTVGSSRNMDLPRNWTLVRAILVHTDVELILLDKRIQELLYRYALSIGEDKAWLDTVFQYPGGRPGRIIRYSRGHHTHYHVRFYNAAAQEMGRRAYRFLLKEKKIKPPTYYVWHKVKSGQTLGHIARRYGTSVSAIKRANGLRSNLIRAGKSYRIPRHGGVRRVPDAHKPPARLVPPTTPSVLASVNWTPAGYPVPVITSVPIRVVATAKSTPGNRRGGTQAVTYRVKSGDSLSVIADRNGVTVADLRKWNRLKTTRIRTGRKLIVGSGPLTSPARSPRCTYKIKQGDSLWGIARAQGITVAELKSLNGLKSDRLAIGQKLRVRKAPGGTTEHAAKTTYTVRPGDNLWTIAKRHGVSVQDLRDRNGLRSDSLKPGQKLAIRSTPVRTADATVRYRVKAGDSLWEIARRHGVSVEQVRSWNSLTSDNLMPGQRLVLYLVR